MGTEGSAEPGTTPLFNRHSLSARSLPDAGDSEMTTKGSLPSVCMGEGELLGPLLYMKALCIQRGITDADWVPDTVLGSEGRCHQDMILNKPQPARESWETPWPSWRKEGLPFHSISLT